ncbi:glycerophosphodiester phosphodiesterase family protein [Opitutus sp. ER46]|uniref:glycerophosphodiester phosphodiesterase n=1 Tax=Opitutus sp. ER46 TaxID=2161864 RepID=UPI001304C405|nr:glycerophosphodiester phosphodiesterase family protein [Opitutus sp. ER46]
MKTSGLLALAAAVLSLPVVNFAAPAGKPYNVTDHIPFEQIVVQGHRGVGELAEENTIEAFEMAWGMGIYPESDLRMTKDGVIVPFHDNDFRRVVKDAPPELARKGVKDLTFAELSELDVGSWKGEQYKGRRVIPMSAVFERMRGRPERHLYMDVKKIDFAKLAAEIHKYGIEKQVILASRLPDELRQWKKLVPESGTLLWVHGTEKEIRRDFAAYRKTGFEGFTQVQIHVFPKVSDNNYATRVDESSSDNPFRLRNDFLREIGEELRQHGVIFQAFPYTTDPTAYGQLLDLGVMSFATDHPDVTMRELKAYYAKRAAARQ